MLLCVNHAMHTITTTTHPHNSHHHHYHSPSHSHTTHHTATTHQALHILGTEYCSRSTSSSVDLGLADLVDKVGQQTGLYGPHAPEGTHLPFALLSVHWSFFIAFFSSRCLEVLFFLRLSS